MSRFFGIAREGSGNSLPSPTVTVLAAGTSTPVALYSDAGLSTPKANPFSGASDGTYDFFVPAGQYKIRVEKTGYTTFEQDHLSVGGVTDHGALTGLSDDDHSQYLHLSISRTISAQHTFNPSSTAAPFALGANAQGQKVVGFNADLLDSRDEAEFTLLAGRSGGQEVIGGTASGNNLRLRSTSHATRGLVSFGSSATTAYDEANERFGVGTASPSAKVHIRGAGTTSSGWANTDSVAHALYVQDSSGGAGNGGLLLLGSAFGVSVGIKCFLASGSGPAGDLVLQTRSTGGDLRQVMRCQWAGNVIFFGDASVGGGAGVLNINNCLAPPSSNPVGGGLLYVESGALKYRGSSGTVTTLGAA